MNTVDEIRGFLNANSLGYLSLEGLLQATGGEPEKVCTACWSDDQPVKLARAESRQMGLFEKIQR